MNKSAPHVRLWRDNATRLEAIVKRVPILESVNKAANTVLSLSLHKFENGIDWVGKDPGAPKRGRQKGS